ncbi:MAG TPA: TMEM175 family protein [Solirubrobacterales bacterium]|nr:TMEM175 family protein [Solirubrobacterales bacterium]
MTDGVFAIAMTLLVLDLPRPEGSAHLAHDLLEQWPSYAAYLVSFVTVGILWIEHHGMMSAVQRINRRFLERTLLFLLCVSVIPWPTAIAADYATSGSQAVPAAILYAVVMMSMGLSFCLGWRYLAAHPEMVVEAARPALGPGAVRALSGGLVYLVAIAVAFLSATASFAIDGVIAVYFALSKSDVPGRIVGAGQGSGDPA